MKKSLKNTYSEHDRTYCLVCKKTFKHLGSHVYHKHKLKANEYKSEYGLAHSLALISQEVEDKKRKHFQKYRTKYLNNFKASNPHRFKKGESSKKHYYARRELERLTKQIQKANFKRKPENCPVCNIQFDFLDSHLFLKHSLLRIKKKEGGLNGKGKKISSNFRGSQRGCKPPKSA